MSAKYEVVVGPMGSGKSQELIERVKRERIAGKRVLILKPVIDNRAGDDFVAARHGDADGGEEFSLKMPAVSVGSYDEFMTLIRERRPQVLAVDEAQLFGDWIIAAIREVLRYGIVERIIVAGLNMDAWGEPFGPMPILMALSEDITSKVAVCTNCKQASGVITQKKSAGTGQRIEIGSKQYTVHCRSCWTPPPES